MKMVRLSLYMILSLLFSVQEFQAQDKAVLEKYAVIKGDMQRIDKDDADASKISGSPFYNKEFEDGQLYFKDHEPLPVKIRYDIVNEEMQVKLNEENYQTVESADFVKIGKSRFKKMYYTTEDGGTAIGYFEFLTNFDNGQSLILLQKHQKSVKRNSRSIERGFSPKYRDDSQEFLKFSNSQRAVMVPARSKDFLNIFPPENSEEVKIFMKENNIKTRKSEDLIALVKFYNSNL